MEIRRVKTALGNLEKLGLIETINKPGYPIFAKAKIKALMELVIHF